MSGPRARPISIERKVRQLAARIVSGGEQSLNAVNELGRLIENDKTGMAALIIARDHPQLLEKYAVTTVTNQDTLATPSDTPKKITLEELFSVSKHRRNDERRYSRSSAELIASIAVQYEQAAREILKLVLSTNPDLTTTPTYVIEGMPGASFSLVSSIFSHPSIAIELTQGDPEQLRTEVTRGIAYTTTTMNTTTIGKLIASIYSTPSMNSTPEKSELSRRILVKLNQVYPEALIDAKRTVEEDMSRTLPEGSMREWYQEAEVKQGVLHQIIRDAV